MIHLITGPVRENVESVHTHTHPNICVVQSPVLKVIVVFVFFGRTSLTYGKQTAGLLMALFGEVSFITWNILTRLNKKDPLLAA